jgi:hypothetical protein
VIRLCKNYLECLDMVVGWLLVVDTVIWGSEICIYFLLNTSFMSKKLSIKPR